MDPTKTTEGTRTWLGALVCVTLMQCGLAVWCSNASAQDILPPTAASAPASAVPTCASNLHLRAVQYDPSEARSFAVFAGSSQRAQPLRRGARIAGYAIERIEQGSVLLSSQSQRCAIHLRGATVDRVLRTVSVDEVRAALRARSRARPIVSATNTTSAIAKIGT